MFDNKKIQNIAEKACHLMRKAGMDTSSCKNAAELSVVFDKCFPKEFAEEAKALIGNRDAVTSLLQTVTGDANIGRKLDGFYNGATASPSKIRRSRK